MYFLLESDAGLHCFEKGLPVLGLDHDLPSVRSIIEEINKRKNKPIQKKIMERHIDIKPKETFVLTHLHANGHLARCILALLLPVTYH